MNDNKGNYEIDAMRVISLLLKRWWVILLFVLVFAMAAFGYTRFFVTPTYESSATLLINGDGGSISSAYQQILAGQYQSKDYPYILGSNDTLCEVAERLNKYDFPANGGKAYRNYTSGVLKGMISSEAVDDSRIFRIKVSSPDPEEARIVADMVAKVFIERAEVLTSSDIGVVDNPIVPANAASRGYGRNLLIGFAVGLVCGFAYAIIVGVTNDNIESEKWLLQEFHNDIPLLAIIPDSNSDHKSYYYYKYKYSRNYGYSEYNQNKK